MGSVKEHLFFFFLDRGGSFFDLTFESVAAMLTKKKKKEVGGM